MAKIYNYKNETERNVDMDALRTLASAYIPKTDQNAFVREVAFRIDGFDEDDFAEFIPEGITIEECYFAACLAYVRNQPIYKQVPYWAFDQLYNEPDSGKIFDYCGSELPAEAKVDDFVVFKDLGGFKTTQADNYYARIRNERKVKNIEGVTSYLDAIRVVQNMLGLTRPNIEREEEERL